MVVNDFPASTLEFLLSLKIHKMNKQEPISLSTVEHKEPAVRYLKPAERDGLRVAVFSVCPSFI